MHPSWGLVDSHSLDFRVHASRPIQTNTNKYNLIQEMPIPADEFDALDDDSPSIDLSPETTQGTVLRYLLENADRAYRQRELVAALDVPAGSIGPTLTRLENHGLVDHRGRYWRVGDDEHAVASATALGSEIADAVDGSFSEEATSAWMETAEDTVDDPPDETNETHD